MSKDRITQSTLEEKLPALLRERLKRDGLSPNIMPSWEYITANTPYSAEGLNINCKKNLGKTLHEHLHDEGFGLTSSSYYATTHNPTIKSIQYYLSSLEKRKGWSNNTISSVKSALKKATVIIKKLDIDSELLSLGKCTTPSEKLQKRQLMIDIFDELNKELEDGTMSNYTHYIDEYYATISNKYQIDQNPAQEVLEEYEFTRKKSDPRPVTESELNRLWTTLNSITESPYERHELDDWRLWMKILIVFMIAVGPRSCEIEQFDTRSQLQLDQDPHVIFKERKNLSRNEGPVEVPIMFGKKFIRMTADYLEEINAEGALIPSPQSSSGCRCASTLNNWIARLCELSDIEFEEHLTIVNFRKTWKTQYHKALRKNRKYIKFISEEDNKKGPESDREDYIDPVENRRAVRELGREHFDELIEIESMPDPMEEVLDETFRFGYQSDLTKF